MTAWEAFDVLATDTFNQFIDLDASIINLINVDLSPLQAPLRTTSQAPKTMAPNALAIRLQRGCSVRRSLDAF